MPKFLASKILLITGSLFIAVSFCYDKAPDSWISINDENINKIDMPNPPAPSFDYINYSDAKNSVTEENLELSLDTDASAQDNVITDLPGDDFHDDGTLPSNAVEHTDKSDLEYMLLGAVKIPKLNISENLFEGTDKEMREGIGHVKKTAMPGESGNCIIAGHRVASAGTPPFRNLDKLENGDAISLTFGVSEFIYEVYDSFIVSKDEVWVLAPVKGETHVLTLITCDPVVSLTRRPNRLIVRARLIYSSEKASPYMSTYNTTG